MRANSDTLDGGRVQGPAGSTGSLVTVGRIVWAPKRRAQQLDFHEHEPLVHVCGLSGIINTEDRLAGCVRGLRPLTSACAGAMSVVDARAVGGIVQGRTALTAAAIYADVGDRRNSRWHSVGTFRRSLAVNGG